MPAPSLQSEGALPQLESQTSSKHLLKGREEGWRKEKEQLCTNQTLHPHVNSADPDQIHSQTHPACSPGCFGVLASVPFTVRQWELSPPQTPHLSSCFREPTSLSQPTCCHPWGKDDKQVVTFLQPIPSLCPPHSPLLHTGPVPGLKHASLRVPSGHGDAQALSWTAKGQGQSCSSHQLLTTHSPRTQML